MTLEVSNALDRARQLTPAMISELEALASIASCAFPGFPPEPVMEAAHAVVDLLKRSGAPNARLVDTPDSYPTVYAEIEAEDATAKPTVLLYAHYDVQPAPADQRWDTDPWVPTKKADGRIYGRGVADDKSGIVMHAGVLRLFDGKPPINIKVIIEGMEETGGDGLVRLLTRQPELARADAFIIADSGNLKAGEPAVTTALRGVVACKVTVQTLEDPLHSGLFGGAAPDALLTLVRLLATLHDEAGATTVKGLHAFDWNGVDLDQDQLRADAGMVEGVEFAGTGTLASRLWSKPSVTIIGMDVPPIAGTPNALVPQASAKLSLRIAPGADPTTEFVALEQHLRDNITLGARLSIEELEVGQPYELEDGNPIAEIALSAMSDAWSTPAVSIGSGGSIPLVAVLQSLNPGSGVLMLGAEDTEKARIHSANESVDPSEIEKCIAAEALFIDRLAEHGLG